MSARRRCSRRRSSLARQVKDTWIISVALGNLGRVVLCADGDPRVARALLAEGLQLARDRSDRRGSAPSGRRLSRRPMRWTVGRRRVPALRRRRSAAETTGAEIYPAESLIQERFLTSVLSDAGFAAALDGPVRCRRMNCSRRRSPLRVTGRADDRQPHGPAGVARCPSWRSRLAAALISARCVKACGKLPSCSPVAPISSE